MSFTDLSRRAPQTLAVQPIDIELHDVTTLRERRGPYTIAATLNAVCPLFTTSFPLSR